MKRAPATEEEQDLGWWLTGPASGGEVRLQTNNQFFTLGTFEQVRCTFEGLLAHLDFDAPEPEIQPHSWRLVATDRGRLSFVWHGADPAVIDLGPVDAAADELGNWVAARDPE